MAIRPSATPEPPKLRKCKECRTPFYPKRVDQDFCIDTCRKTFHKRRISRGLELLDAAMLWRGKRLKGGFTKFCQMIDDWRREDKQRLKEHDARIAEECRRNAVE